MPSIPIKDFLRSQVALPRHGLSDWAFLTASAVRRTEGRTVGLFTEKPTKIWFHFVHAQGIAFWLNGKLIHKNPKWPAGAANCIGKE